MRLIIYNCVALIGLCICSSSLAALIQVGPGKEFVSPSVAAEFAVDGDVVEIDATGHYDGDVAVWRQNNLTIKGVNGRPHIRGTGRHAEGKALWVIKGSNITVENIEFSGAVVPDHNGAGIRHEGRGLTIRYCYFHHNENGLLSSSDSKSRILIEYSEFSHNGYGKGRTHNIYIGRIEHFILRYSYIHHAKIGHNVKSRAKETQIISNRIMDESDGSSSYAIDVPNGGLTYIVGNVIQQGPRTENWTVIAYGAEGLRKSANHLWAINNTIVNDRSRGFFFKIADRSKAKLINNLLVGKGKLLEGEAAESHNLGPLRDAGLLGRTQYDYRLDTSSLAIDAGLSVSELQNLEGNLDQLTRFEYRHIADKQLRDISGAIDIGAYEYREFGD
ncbi:MAG: right-handed parallel beta-helix repeat-containing protein [Gammaproteobacteria bacterium]|nr:right-handed parallel beta-helix repeat-containing protein [Gammaproteobacteria bacterium]MCF6261481.1 right-handed parallel beta-helix repeat-containing protein [Gammaproteobacteria bacterium]